MSTNALDETNQNVRAVAVCSPALAKTGGSNHRRKDVRRVEAIGDAAILTRVLRRFVDKPC